MRVVGLLSATCATAVVACFSPTTASAETAAQHRAASGTEEQSEPYHKHRDIRHGHDHIYPDRGSIVRDLPAGTIGTSYAGVSYRYHDGIWLEPRGPAYMVIAPPIGLVAPTLPLYSTVVTHGTETFLYVNDTYYRGRPDLGGYEVVNDPTLEPPPAPDALVGGQMPGAPPTTSPGLAAAGAGVATVGVGMVAASMPVAATGGTAPTGVAGAAGAAPVAAVGPGAPVAAVGPGAPVASGPVATQVVSFTPPASASGSISAQVPGGAAGQASGSSAAQAPGKAAAQVAGSAAAPVSINAAAAGAVPVALPTVPVALPTVPVALPAVPGALPAAALAPGAQRGPKVFLYPKNGQTADQQARDRYDCYRFAVAQSGFDPMHAAGAAPAAPASELQSDYDRAQSACFEARGYINR